jgi:hypothetical protein
MTNRARRASGDAAESIKPLVRALTPFATAASLRCAIWVLGYETIARRQEQT